MGLTQQDVGSSLGAALGGGYVNYFSIAGRSYKVIPQVLQKYRLNPNIEIDYYIRAGDEILNVKLDVAKKYHCLVVRDNGIGFDPAYSEQIFELFNRLHNKNDYSGTGIGLALCRKIVENHHGIMKASSVKGEGAVFFIYLPVD